MHPNGIGRPGRNSPVIIKPLVWNPKRGGCVRGGRFAGKSSGAFKTGSNSGDGDEIKARNQGFRETRYGVNVN